MKHYIALTCSVLIATSAACVQSGEAVGSQAASLASEIGKPCEPAEADSCPSYLVCDKRSERCALAPCYTSDECAAGTQCVDLQCVPPGALAGEGQACAADADCPDYLVCRAGLHAKYCQRPECYRAADCPDGQWCYELTCVAVGHC
ncbi:MAG: hypothetical protein HY744_25605 [Deltaproteobacteria bacterium]|nr:hypothetical protein [Deltaproteobacteria bacterium]